jgi:hypothetical protein
MRLPSTPVVTLAKEIIQYMIVADARQAPDRTRNSCDIDVTMPRGVNGIELAYCIHEFYASFKFSMGGLAGQVRAPARRSEYLTRVEKAS